MNYDFSAPHLASAARLAIAFRFLGESILALALPPMRPPRRPNRTAADVAHDVAEVVAALAPVIEDRAAIEEDHVDVVRRV